MNTHTFSLSFVNILLKLAKHNLKFETQNIFRSIPDAIALEKLKDIMSKTIKGSKTFDRELSNKIQKNIKDYNLTQTLSANNTSDLMQLEVNSNSISTNPTQEIAECHPITSDEWAALCKEVIQNGEILDLNNLEVHSAWSILLKDLTTLSDPSAQVNSFLSFLGQLTHLGRQASVEAIHNYLHLLYLTSFNQENDMTLASLSQVTTHYILDGLEFGDFDIKFENAMKLLIDNSIIDNSFFEGLYNQHHQSKHQSKSELTDVQDWVWNKSVLERFEYQTRKSNMSPKCSISSSIIPDVGHADVKSSKTKQLRRNKSAPNDERKVEYSPLVLLSIPDHDDTNFLSADEATEAFERAIKDLKENNEHFTMYNSYQVVTYYDGKQYCSFALKKPIAEGAQGVVQLSQELFSTFRENKNKNTCTAKYSTNFRTFNDYKIEAEFLRIQDRYKGSFSSTNEKPFFYYQFSNFIQGRDGIEICYYKDENGKLIKRKLDNLTTITLMRGMVTVLCSMYEQLHFLHGDVKLSNFIFDKFGNVNAVDFGNSVWPINASDSQRGTPVYQAPETGEYNLKKEIYSLGLSYAELLSKENFQLFNDEMMKFIQEKRKWLEVVPFEKIKKAMPDIYIKIPKTSRKEKHRWDIELKVIIQQMTDPDPKLRPDFHGLKKIRSTIIQIQDRLVKNINSTVFSESDPLPEFAKLNINGNLNNPSTITHAFNIQKKTPLSELDMSSLVTDKDDKDKKPSPKKNSSDSIMSLSHLRIMPRSRRTSINGESDRTISPNRNNSASSKRDSPFSSLINSNNSSNVNAVNMCNSNASLEVSQNIEDKKKLSIM